MVEHLVLLPSALIRDLSFWTQFNNTVLLDRDDVRVGLLLLSPSRLRLYPLVGSETEATKRPMATGSVLQDRPTSKANRKAPAKRNWNEEKATTASIRGENDNYEDDPASKLVQVRRVLVSVATAAVRGHSGDG